MAEQKGKSSSSNAPAGTTAATAAPKTPARSPAEKRGKFLEIAERRTKNALKTVRRLRPLSNRALYDYKPEEVGAMLDALRTAVDDVERAFSDRKVTESEFKF